MTETTTSEIEYAVLCMHEKSKDHVTADFMCAHARATGLKLFTTSELARLATPRRPGLYVVPLQGEGDTISLTLLEVSGTATRIRNTDVKTSANWAVTCRWLFKR